MIFILFLVIGLVIGSMAGSIVESPILGKLRNIIVGVIGALFGGYFLSVLSVSDYSIIESTGMSVLGAVTFLMVAGLVKSTLGSGKDPFSTA